MRAVREYFGVDQTTVTYEQEITGVGGNADEFFILCEAGGQQGRPAVRTTIYFMHDEVAHLFSRISATPSNQRHTAAAPTVRSVSLGESDYIMRQRQK